MLRSALRRFAPVGTVLVLGTATVLAADAESVVLEVPGLNCAPCPVTVKEAVQRVPGVLDTHADLKTKRAVVRYDPEKVTQDRLAAAVTNAGFPATVLPQ